MKFQSSTRFTVNSRKYDGSIRRSWVSKLTARNGDVLDLIGKFDQQVEHPDLGQIEAGTISHERFYPNRWYNYFVFEHPAGKLRNYYINICLPPTIGNGVIDYVDLDIDIIVWPDGRVVTVDFDEFETNAARFGYPPDVRVNALATFEQIEKRLKDEPDVCRAVARL